MDDVNQQRRDERDELKRALEQSMVEELHRQKLEMEKQQEEMKKHAEDPSVMRWKRRMRSCRRSSRRRVQVWNHQGHHSDDLSTTRCHLRQEQPLEEFKFHLDNHRWIQ